MRQLSPTNFKFLMLTLLFLISSQTPVSAAVTWSASSPNDNYNRPDLDSRYDVIDVDAAIFDDNTSKIWFFLNFKNVPSINIFNDSRGSWGAIQLDYDFDGGADYSLALSDVTLKTDRTTVAGSAYRYSDRTYLNCEIEVYTNISESKNWIGFVAEKSCINLPSTFGMRGYADFIANDSTSFDYGPDEFFRVTLPGASSSSSSSGSSTSSGKTYELPANLANSSTLARNFTEAPVNLTKLSEVLLPSVVTVLCGSGSGTGWSAEVALSKALIEDGFKSYVITNHHVIEDCIRSRSVSLLLSDKSTVPGTIIAWNESSDVASIATKTPVVTMQWIGSAPKQGWWVGVIGSPLGKPGILTTGIISSVNANSGTFTMTAPINPGNSGGPVFDSTGRVLGLATSKNLISSNQIAEGFGNAQGVTLLCSSVIMCIVERDPWAATSKFTSGPTPSEIEALAKAEAEAKAKAEAEAKVKAESEAKAELQLKLREEKSKVCLNFNGDLKVQIFSAETAKSMFPKAAGILKSLLDRAPNELDCNYINLDTFDSELFNQQKLLNVFQIAIADAVSSAKVQATKKITITCVKGKLTKKITATNPKCPAGFKKR